MLPFLCLSVFSFSSEVVDRPTHLEIRHSHAPKCPFVVVSSPSPSGPVFKAENIAEKKKKKRHLTKKRTYKKFKKCKKKEKESKYVIIYT